MDREKAFFAGVRAANTNMKLEKSVAVKPRNNQVPTTKQKTK